MLAQRAPESHVTGVDIDDVGQARENAAASPWSGRWRSLNAPCRVRDPGAVRSDRLQPAVFRRLAHLPRAGAHRGPPCRAPAVRRPARRRPPPAGSRRPVCRHPSHGRSGAFPSRSVVRTTALVRRTDVRTTPRRPGQTGADGVSRRPPRRPSRRCSADRPAALPPIVPPPRPEVLGTGRRTGEHECYTPEYRALTRDFLPEILTARENKLHL